jgi:hypothetical protein
VEVLRLVVEEVQRGQVAALTGTMPDWLARLVALWDRLQATVITFNYDTLIEYAVNSVGMPWVQQQPPPNVDIFQGLPGANAPAEPVIARFGLLKMHGSIGWWWIPQDTVGNTITRVGLPGLWGEPKPLEGPAGFERFVIPPLATKSTFLDLGPIRELWRRARRALAEADRVVIIGYSAPLTDLDTAALLSLHIPREKPVIVVDLDPTPVADRLKRIGVEVAERFEGVGAAEDFASTYELSVPRRVTADLRALLDNPAIDSADRVMAGTIGPSWAFALKVVTDADNTVIIADDPTREFGNVDDALTVEDLRQALQEAEQSGRGIVLRFPGVPDRAALNISPRMFNQRLVGIEG